MTSLMQKISRCILFTATLFTYIFLFTTCTSLYREVSPFENQFSNRQEEISENEKSKSIKNFTSIVETKNGKVRGLFNKEKTVEFYGSIPYAVSPVGELRWKEPVPAKSWEGILDATKFPALAMQYRASPFLARIFDSEYKNNPAYATVMSEDCLYLNIWKPSSINKNKNNENKNNENKNNENKKLAVLVYFHGGAFIIGGSMESLYHGECMAFEQDIIFVTVNYRLGIFGYFAHEELAKESEYGTTGNYGLLDQILALKWINENIESFGGDSKNITIAGQSAGSSSVNALCASPLTRGLFSKAIGQSSSLVAPKPFHSFSTMQESLLASKKAMKYFRSKSIEDMRQISVKKLTRYIKFFPGITIDGYALPKSVYEIYKDGENHEEALLNGYNKDEVGGLKFFIWLSRGRVNKKNYAKKLEESFGKNYKIIEKEYPGNSTREAQKNYEDLVNMAGFAHTHRNWSKMLKSQNVPVYEYYFSKENTSEKKLNDGYPYTFGFTGVKGADNKHGSEIPYAYGNMKGNSYTKDDFALREIMMSYWANFARYGNPNGEGLTNWEAYNKNEKVLNLSSSIKMIEDPNKDACKLIETLYE